jgi:hypothetical protein
MAADLDLARPSAYLFVNTETSIATKIKQIHAFDISSFILIIQTTRRSPTSPSRRRRPYEQSSTSPEKIIRDPNPPDPTRHAYPTRIADSEAYPPPFARSAMQWSYPSKTHSITILPTSLSCGGSYPNCIGSDRRLLFGNLSMILTDILSPACLSAGTPQSSNSLASK